MAVRVRKLAREVQRGPEEVLGLLHALGFDRYRTPDDMLPDAMVDAVKLAIRQRVQPVAFTIAPATPPPEAPRARAENRAATDGSEASGDLMSRLVPGVVRAGKPVPKTALPAVSPPTSPAASAASAASASPAARHATPPDPQYVNERERLKAEWSVLTEERITLARERDALTLERADLARERDALAAERASAAAAPPVSGAVFADLLANRGLRGLDEFERALGALASARLLGDLLVRLRVDDAEHVEKFLRDRLVLVAGDAPVGLGAAAVTVAPDRAEVSDGAGAQKAIARIGESLLLAGLRRVLFVGGRAAWHKLLRAHLDARLEVRFLPAAPRGRAEAELDVQRTDVVVLWNTPADGPAREVYGQSRAVAVFVEQDSIAALASALQDALKG